MSWFKHHFHWLSTLCKKLSSKETFLFLTFVLIAALFWMLLAFNNNMTHDITINVAVKKPKNVTLINDVPSTITVTVKDRGLSFLKSFFKSRPTIEIDFSKYNNEKTNTMEVNSGQLINEVRRALNSEANIIKIMPESIASKYTTLPGKKVPVNWEDNIENIIPDKQFVINPDMIKTDPDSVVIYALDQATLFKIKEVDISTVEVANLTSTFTKDVNLKGINNVRIIPDRVKLTVPVEPLIRKDYNASISLRNLPSGVKVPLFPPSVNVSFLVPQSHYRDPVNLTVIVDYNDIDPNYNKVKIKLGEVSGNYTNVTLPIDSVGYLIERY
ncbi:MAG: hypothetical protein IK100_05530 [Muribaculaceae bacterium]|nr:hypothetical protein [Muribaculaceae bacterium]